MTMRNRTREEQKRERWAHVVQLLAVAVILCVMLLILGLDSGPVPGATVDEAAATFAAAQEYERVMGLYGDREGAEACAEIVYREAMGG